VFGWFCIGRTLWPFEKTVVFVVTKQKRGPRWIRTVTEGSPGGQVHVVASTVGRTFIMNDVPYFSKTDVAENGRRASTAKRKTVGPPFYY
jgi:hypothetical protein